MSSSNPALDDVLNSFQVDPSVAVGESDVQRTTYDFSTDDDWYTGETDSSLAVIDNGVYDITLKEDNIYFLSDAEFMSAGTDMSMSTDVEVRGDVRAGVALRYSKNDDGERSFYACWIDGEGNYGCFVSVNDQWTALQELTASDAIKPGRTNRVELSAADDKITFSVNGVKVATFDDNSVSEGVPAFYLENFDTEAGAVFDDATITTPK